MSDYTHARFSNSNGEVKDPTARAVELMGPLPKTNECETLADNAHVEYTNIRGLAKTEWQPPAMCVIKRDPMRY